VVTRDARNRVGWVLWVAPTLLALSGAGLGYAELSAGRFDGSLPGAALLAWAGGFSLVLFILLTGLVIPLIFPDGHLRTRRWRAVAALVAASIGLTISGLMFDPAPLVPGVPNPFGIAGAHEVLGLLGQIGTGGILLSLPLVIAAVVVRFRLGSAVEREQIKWFAVGIVVPIVLLATALALQTVEWLWAGSVAALGLIPITIGIAILRYRLYEIDRLISRTIAYAIVTGILGATFVGTIIGIQALLTSFTQSETIAVAASTLVAFALFQPLRRRVQDVVDRRFHRAAIDAERTTAAYATRLRDGTGLEAVGSGLRETVELALQPRTTSVWLRGRDR
jgi:hypothetical protein